eukprot:COSAG02_NODE_6635_length_3446_cov_1.849716_1_plen_49_part_00
MAGSEGGGTGGNFVSLSPSDSSGRIKQTKAEQAGKLLDDLRRIVETQR